MKILGLKLVEFVLSKVIAHSVMLCMIFSHGYTAPTWPYVSIWECFVVKLCVMPWPSGFCMTWYGNCSLLGERLSNLWRCCKVPLFSWILYKRVLENMGCFFLYLHVWFILLIFHIRNVSKYCNCEKKWCFDRLTCFRILEFMEIMFLVKLHRQYVHEQNTFLLPKCKISVIVKTYETILIKL
jgi:hypothetical protein